MRCRTFQCWCCPADHPTLTSTTTGESRRARRWRKIAGRIVFVVSPAPIFTLTEFGQWLAGSDLELNAALNLDGGTSAGLVLRSGNRSLGVDSWVEVPNVIVVERR